jgi:succinoglycan biosynthesis transport protein ExoP
LREGSNRVFCTGTQVHDVLRVSCLATLPFLRPVTPSTAADSHEDGAALTQASGARQSDSLLTHALDEPFSEFTEFLRSLIIAADLERGAQANTVIGFTSTLPNEGKSTIAANFAGMIAHAGSRVILVDADLHNPSLSQSFYPDTSAGLVEVISGEATLDDAMWSDHRSGLIILPAGPHAAKVLHPNVILASTAIKSLIGKLRDTFDYVVVDLPPLAPVADARTTASFIDSYVYVVEWGRTKTDVVKYSLSNAPEIYKRILGVVLNKAKMSVVQRYEPYRTSRYYRKYSQSSKSS